MRYYIIRLLFHFIYIPRYTCRAWWTVSQPARCPILSPAFNGQNAVNATAYVLYHQVTAIYWNPCSHA